MKKLTLEQALKTPNIAFEVKPHQAERVITAFDLNKKDIPNIGYARTNREGLYEGWYTNTQVKDDWFNTVYTPIMVEIIEEESNTFNSQQEVWQWLDKGNRISYQGSVYGYKDGSLHNYSKGVEKYLVKDTNFLNYNDVTKYKEPKYITVNGFQVPKPITSLEGIDIVYYPDFTSHIMYAMNNSKLSIIPHLLSLNILHTNKEAAYIHAQAMLGYME